MSHKKGVELSINLVIVAGLAVIAMVIVFAILTGRLAIFSQTLSECKANCVGKYVENTKNSAFSDHVPVQNAKCDPQFETEQPGSFIASGQSSATPPQDLVRCTKCCLRT